MPEAATALTIGNFDGVHVGHAALVRRARELADREGRGRVVALLFDPHPAAVLRPEAVPARLSTFEQRARRLVELGVDEVVRVAPSKEFLSQTPEQFVRGLVERYGPRVFVEGEDFRFGKGRAGDVGTLAELGLGFGFEVETVAPVEVALGDHLIVRASSSIVRWLLSRGRVRDAALVLGRPYELCGNVVKGDQVGRQLGFPTANLDTPCLIPSDGIYAAMAELPDGTFAAAAVNVGSRPTFNGSGRRAEAHLMLLGTECGPGRATSLSGSAEYGWPLSLSFVAWLRDDARFESVESLVDQIRRDCDRVMRVLALDPLARSCAAAAAGKDSLARV